MTPTQAQRAYARARRRALYARRSVVWGRSSASSPPSASCRRRAAAIEPCRLAPLVGTVAPRTGLVTGGTKTNPLFGLAFARGFAFGVLRTAGLCGDVPVCASAHVRAGVLVCGRARGTHKHSRVCEHVRVCFVSTWHGSMVEPSSHPQVRFTIGPRCVMIVYVILAVYGGVCARAQPHTHTHPHARARPTRTHAHAQGRGC
jgi:hypothetical protein